MEAYLYSTTLWLVFGNILALFLVLRLVNRDSHRRGERYKYLIEQLDAHYAYSRSAILQREEEKAAEERKSIAGIKQELLEHLQPCIDSLVYFVKFSSLFSPKAQSQYFPSLTYELLVLEKQDGKRLAEEQKERDQGSQKSPSPQLKDTEQLISRIKESILADIEEQKLLKKYRDSL